MPRGDGTGPVGGGMGRGLGGQGQGQQGKGRGRMGGFGLGVGGSCVCPKCSKTLPHERGAPCSQIKCPACGTAMTRSQ